MRFHQPSAETFIPDGLKISEALARVTHLGIGAHQDDLEFMAFHGILECFKQNSKCFGGVTCSDGSGSPRGGALSRLSDLEMKERRRLEQNQAAIVGRYGVMIQLAYPSDMIKNPNKTFLKNDLFSIIDRTRPEVVYTHNPADKHKTHIGGVIATIEAIRGLSRKTRPGRVIGCELWRDLDWMPDEEKILMDVSGGAKLAGELNSVFQTQIASGKRYDIATNGRRAANATFFDPNSMDAAREVIIGMDLTPLVQDETLNIVEFISVLIGRFHNRVKSDLLMSLGQT